MKTTLPIPAPEPRSAAELTEWALAEIRRPATTPRDYQLRHILNDLINGMKQEATR